MSSFNPDQKPMLRKVALGCSIIGHPVFLFFFTFLFFGLTSYQFAYIPSNGLPYIGALIFLNTVFSPIIFTYLINNDLWIEKRQQRFIPLMGTAILYLATWYYLKMVTFPYALTLLLLILTMAIAILLILNLWWKISFHTVGMGALIGFFGLLTFLKGAISIWPLFTVVLLAGIIGSARLFLVAHTQKQVYVGYCLGLILALVTGFFW